MPYHEPWLQQLDLIKNNADLNLTTLTALYQTQVDYPVRIRINATRHNLFTVPSNLIDYVIQSDCHVSVLYLSGITQLETTNLLHQAIRDIPGDLVERFNLMDAAFARTRKLTHFLRHKATGNIIVFTTLDPVLEIHRMVIGAIALRGDAPIMQPRLLEILGVPDAFFNRADRDRAQPIIEAYEAPRLAQQRQVEMRNDLANYLFKSVNHTERINRMQADIEGYYRTIQVELEKLRDLRQLQFALDNGFSNNPSAEEAIEYMVNTRAANIIYCRTGRNVVYIGVASVLRFSEPMDDYKRGMERSSTWNRLAAWRKTLFLDIIEGIVRLPIRAEFKFTVNNNNIEINGSHEHMEYASPAHLVNAHINNYDCFSTAKNELQRYLQEQDGIAFTDKLIATTAGVNPYDGAVMPNILEQYIALSDQMQITYRTPDGWVGGTIKEYMEVRNAQTATNT